MLINGIGLRQAGRGQVSHQPPCTAVSILLHASVLSATDRSHGADHRVRFQPCRAFGRAAERLQDSRRRSPNILAWELNHTRAPNVKGQAGKSIPSLPSCRESCAGAAQSLHAPNISALLQAKSSRTSNLVLQNKVGDQRHAVQPRPCPHLLPTSLRQEWERCFSLFFFLFFFSSITLC